MPAANKKKYVFVGNRGYVLEEMLRLGLDITGVWVMENSFLHRTLAAAHEPLANIRDLQIISNKTQLLALIEASDFDVLISNGCKYILPVSSLKKAQYINIHPSYLPDMKGMDPINGACLYGRDCGAACHVMDDGIDTGRIIARVRVPMTGDIEAALLYQLCFKAEVMAFREAYEKGFEPLAEQPRKDDAIYFSMKPSDWLVKFENGFDFVLRQAKAFGYQSKGLYFQCNGQRFHFYRASELVNPFVTDYCRNLQNMQTAFVFEHSVVFKFEGRVMRFDQVENAYGSIREGDVLSSCPEETAALL